jgi:ABC-type antimicrobial peptide transport system permease subunit
MPCKDGTKRFTTFAFWGDYNMLGFFGIPLLSGQNFTSGDPQFGGVIVNREMAGMLGWEDIIGLTIPMFNSPKEIIGEMNNFNFQSFRQPIGAMAIFYLLEDVEYLYVKTVPGKTGEAISAVENIWKRYNDGYPFETHFLDEEFHKMYQSDIRTGNLFTAFAFIAILISCLGLFGLVTFFAESKTKEIGIRKVFGASVADIVIMLSKEFLILVGIAMVIAFPMAYYWLDRMLQDYAYRIDIGWWMFALAGIITVVLTVLTVGWQAVKAATTNPVEAIKSE